jgi:hypothetical protein
VKKQPRLNAEAVLNEQVAAWIAEIARLEALVAHATGRVGVALVKIAPTDGEDYHDVAVELILEDALQVGERGWPEGFTFELLNRTS